MNSSTKVTSSWRVRLATENDAESIAAFNEAMALETESRRLDPETVRNGVLRLMAQPALGLYLVAESQPAGEGGIAGCLLITYEWSDWRDGLFFWIQSVYVRPEWRGCGVFRALFRAVEARAADQGDVCGLRLYVERENRVAQQTYARLGMHETDYRLWETPLG